MVPRSFHSKLQLSHFLQRIIFKVVKHQHFFFLKKLFIPNLCKMRQKINVWALSVDKCIALSDFVSQSKFFCIYKKVNREVWSNWNLLFFLTNEYIFVEQKITLRKLVFKGRNANGRLSFSAWGQRQL